MSAVIGVALPLFLIIFTGFFCGKRGVVSPEAIGQVVPIVLYVFLPAFIFMRVMDIPSGVSINISLLEAYYSAALLVAVYVFLTGRYLRKQSSDVIALRSLASIAGVVGYMGLPLIVLSLGNSSALPALILVTADNLLVLVGGSVLILMLSQQKRSWRTFAFAIATGIAKNPLIMSFFISLAIRELGLHLPTPIALFLNQLSAAAGPTALFLLGCILAGVKKSQINIGDITEVVLLKLLVFPALVYIIGTQFGLNVIELKASVIMAALPIAVNVFILANKSAAYTHEASTGMFVSTCLSVITLSVLLICIV